MVRSLLSALRRLARRAAAGPPLVRPGGARAALLAGATAAGLAVAACGGDAGTAPGQDAAPARIALSVELGALTTTAPESLVVAYAYLRTAGAPVPLGERRFALGEGASQQLPLTVPLGVCLADPARRGGGSGEARDGSCVLRLTLSLVQGSATLDQQTVEPVVVRPGQTASVGQPVALFTVARVLLAANGAPVGPGPVRVAVGSALTLTADARDAQERPVTSRTPTWTSDAPAVATVDAASGVVTAHAPGQATITATVGGRTATTAVRVVLPPAPITVTVAGGAGSGTVTSQPAGLACQVAAGRTSGTCTLSFPADAPVTLVAEPAVGSAFGTWGGDCAPAGGLLTCTVTPDAPRTAAVTFVAQRAVQLALAGNGGGTVSAAGPGALACTLAAAPFGSAGPGATSGTCAVVVPDGTTLTLTAAPVEGSRFVGWGGACAAAGTAPTCTIAADEARTVAATFARVQRTLTLVVGGSGAGTVTATGAGVVGEGVCTLAPGAGSTTCAVPVQQGATVTLTAAAGQASAFDGWSGACAGATGPTCSLAVTADATVGAVFPRLPVALAVGPAAGNAGSGTVTTPDGALDCAIAGGTGSGRCQTTVPAGATVTLTATPAAGHVFVGWGGACAGAQPTCTLTLQQATSATVAFARATSTLTLRLEGSPGGSVQLDGATVCTLGPGGGATTCAVTVLRLATVTLGATPGTNASFTGWSGACAGTGPCTLVVTGDVTVGAGFAPVPLAVTVVSDPANAGPGTVTSTPRGIVCGVAGAPGTSCTTTFLAGSTVTLVATPASPSIGFAGWSGACAGQQTATCTLTDLAAAATVGVRFTPIRGTLVILADPQGDGSGSVLTTDERIVCLGLDRLEPGSCRAEYALPATITVQAVPNAQSTFGGWSGATCAEGNNSLTCTVQLCRAGSLPCPLSDAPTGRLFVRYNAVRLESRRE